MPIDRSVFGLAQFCEKLQRHCVLQYFVGIDLLMLCKVEGQKIRETTCGLIYQDDNRSVFALKIGVEFVKRFASPVNYKTSCASIVSGLLV